MTIVFSGFFTPTRQVIRYKSINLIRETSQMDEVLVDLNHDVLAAAELNIIGKPGSNMLGIDHI